MGAQLMAGNDWGSTEVTGLKELNEALKQLPENIAKNVLRGATGAGAAVIRKDAVARAPFYIPASVMWGGDGGMAKNHPPPGTLKKSIYQVRRRELSTLVQQVFAVAVRTGKGQRDKAGRSVDAYYWRFVEFGTSKMAARPFLRPAFEAKKLAAIDAIKDYLAQRIPREVDKLKKGPRV